VNRRPLTALDELAQAMRDARRAARFERFPDRRIAVLDRDFDNYAMGA
jgi:hypothetical protein